MSEPLDLDGIDVVSGARQRYPGQTSADVSLPALAVESIDVEMIYPAAAAPWLGSGDCSTAQLTSDFATSGPAARVFKITSRAPKPD